MGISRTRSSVVRALSLPPPWRGSTKVSSPTRVSVPGLPAAMSRNKWQITPWGRFQASIWLSTASFWMRGTSPQWPPITRRRSPGVAQVVQPAVLAVALPGGVDQRQVARRLRGLEALRQCHGDGFGKADAHKTAGGHGVAVVDQLHRIGGAHDLVLCGWLAGRGPVERACCLCGASWEEEGSLVSAQA
jgi:hypothetical protein